MSKSDKSALLLAAQLLYREKPQFDPWLLFERLHQARPKVELLSNPRGDMAHFAHPDHVMNFADGTSIPAQSCVTPGQDPLSRERLEIALQQTYDWPQARQVTADCTADLLVAEFLARLLPYRTRVELFQSVLLATIEQTSPVAIVSLHSQRVISPATWLTASGSANPHALAILQFNVRMFQITNGQPGDRLMDTRGLSELGLPDLQIHFRNLEPGRVAAHLFNSALYIFDNGDCIEEGHTIEGLERGQAWKCQHEMAMMGPERVVIDFNPGPLHAAGKRH